METMRLITTRPPWKERLLMILASGLEPLSLGSPLSIAPKIDN